MEGGGLGSVNSRSTSATHYFLALEDLWRSDYLNRYFNPKSIYRAQINENINIGIINTDINTFKENAVDIGALLVQGVDSLFYDNPNSSISPYKTYRNSFIAAPLKEKIHVNNKVVNFKVPAIYWKETTQYPIKRLEINFDDGNGFVKTPKETTKKITYPSYGKKNISFRTTFTNDQVKTVNSTFGVFGVISEDLQVLTAIDDSSDCNLPTSLVFSSNPYTFKGYDESQSSVGIGKYVNHSGTNCIKNPVIVVEGYDPDDSIDNGYIYNNFLNQNYLGVNLKNVDYDVLTLDFKSRIINGKAVAGGSDYIKRNAMVLVKLITLVNQKKNV